MGSLPDFNSLYRADLDDRRGDKDFTWRPKDFIRDAAVVEINDRVQVGRGSGFAEVGGKETHSKCSWKKMLLRVSSRWVIPGQS